MADLAALVLGYLIGSILPAVLVARLSGVDIRAIGTRNPGATNTWSELGPVRGAIVLVFDLAKGLLAMWAASAIGAGPLFVYGAGLAAVVGHRLPVFFHFRGGEGVGASTGLMLYSLVVALSHGWLAPMTLGTLAIAALLAFLVWRRGPVVAVLVLPVLAALVLVNGDAAYRVFTALPMANIWLVNVGNVRREHLLRNPRGLDDLRRSRRSRLQRR